MKDFSPRALDILRSAMRQVSFYIKSTTSQAGKMFPRACFPGNPMLQ